MDQKMFSMAPRKLTALVVSTKIKGLVRKVKDMYGARIPIHNNLVPIEFSVSGHGNV
jgi:hypothetical protein